MTFPTINYKYNSIEEAKLLAEVVDQKFSTLDRFVGDNSAICEVEFEKIAAHQHGRFYRVEANLSIKGELYRAEATEDSFEKAIDEVRHGLEQELSKAKDKHHTQKKDKGRFLKRLFTRSE
jgi:ribosomal subunit interface protein